MSGSSAVEDFITRWRGADGSELANAQSFTREPCEMLGVPVPDPAQADIRAAECTVSLYLKKGMTRPSIWLSEIVGF